MAKLETKKEGKTKTAATKITESQNEKLTKLAEKKGLTKSNLIAQLIGIGYKEATKTKREF